MESAMVNCIQRVQGPHQDVQLAREGLLLLQHALVAQVEFESKF
jgi:hypothetical protein